MIAAVRRRALLASALALAAPRAGALAGSRILRFVPQSDLSVMDPVWTSGFVVRNAAYMIYDTLYATDSRFQVRPQMAEGHETSADGLRWTIRLRPGLRFHDNEPVRAADCVASIRRWAQRDPLGQVLMAQTDELAALDDRNLQFRLRRPFPMLVETLGKFASPVLFIMPERSARLPASEPVRETIGSGPFRYRADEAIPGSHYAWERFASYVPRDEKPDNTAGGKVVRVPGVEWTVIPEAQTAIDALQTGQEDWLEQPLADLLPLVAHDPTITVRALDELGSYVIMRFNQLFSPFDDVRLRRAVLIAARQSEFMQAMGGDPALSRDCRSFFPCGTQDGEEAPRGSMPGDVDAARKMVAESGYDGRPVLILSVSDKPYLSALADVTADLLKRIGMRPDLVSVDWATNLTRRASRKPPDQGGWNIVFTTAPASEFANPAANILLSGAGAKAWIGWYKDARMEQLRRDWLYAPEAAQRLAIARSMQAEAFATVPFVPLGQFRQATAYRRAVTGIVASSAPLFWNLTVG